MRGLTALYTYACEEEGCIANSALVDYFRKLDLAEDEEGTAALYPDTLDLRNNYLGDAGAAACFRTLVLMRWIRRVEAAGVGAGPQAMRALCAVLTTKLPVAGHSTQKGGSADLVGPAEDQSSLPDAVLPIEYVDLRSNDLFALSARELVKALKERERWLRSVSPAHAQQAPHLQVLIDMDTVPLTTARAVELYNRESRRCLAEAAAKAAQVALEERQRLFCNVSLQPTGQQVLYRIPEMIPPSLLADRSTTQEALFYDVTNPFITSLVKDINKNMEAYLVAYRCFTAAPSCEAAVASTSPSAAASAAAAAQVSVDFGADALCYLPFTNAAHWYTGDSAESSVAVAEVLHNVQRLIRGLNANPALEEEAASRRGALLKHYLKRIRELFYELQLIHTHKVPLSDNDSRLVDLRSLYYRVVSALVVKPMLDLPSMAHVEERVTELYHLLVDCMFDGVTLKELEERRRALRLEDLELLQCAVNKQRKVNCEDNDERLSLWPTWCAQCKYMQHNEKEACTRWNAAFMGNSSSSSANTDGGEASTAGASEGQSLPSAFEAFGHCTCRDEDATSREDIEHPVWIPSPSKVMLTTNKMHLPRPCPACCHDAVSELHTFLTDKHVVARSQLMDSIRPLLPTEVRLFMLDIVIRRNSRGCAYVPAIFSNPSALETVYSERADPILLLDSAVDFFAFIDGKRERLCDFINAFAEWYRLRMIESFDVTAVPFAHDDDGGRDSAMRATTAGSTNAPAENECTAVFSDAGDAAPEEEEEAEVEEEES